MPAGEWLCAFNPDSAHRECSAPEQQLDGGSGDEGEQLAILQAPGFVPAAAAVADGHEPYAENVAFFQRVLGQRAGGGGTAARAPMAAAWWLAREAMIPVRACPVTSPVSAGRLFVGTLGSLALLTPVRYMT